MQAEGGIGGGGGGRKDRFGKSPPPAVSMLSAS